MADPKRWLTDGDAPEAAIELLRALDVPAPPSIEKQGELVRQLAALAAPAAGAPALATGVLIKVGLVCSAAIGGAVFLATRLVTDAPPPSAPQTETVSPARVAAPAQPELLTELSAAREDERKLIVHEGVVPSKRPKPEAAPRDTLAEEEALLERARGLISTDADAAWFLLEQHRRRFPAAQLAAERIFLSIEALERRGDIDAASSQEKRLAHEYPESVYARQLKAARKTR